MVNCSIHTAKQSHGELFDDFAQFNPEILPPIHKTFFSL
jgi:hypothetical protein